MERITDDEGNELLFNESDRAVYLKLQGREEIRKLGFIRSRVFYTRRKKANTMRSLGDIGFSSLLITRGNFDLVRVQFADGHEFEIARKTILERGKWKHFTSGLFELQVFIPLSALTPVPTAPDTNHKTVGKKSRRSRYAKVWCNSKGQDLGSSA